MLDDRGKAVLRLFAGAEHAVATADPRAMAVRVVRRGRVVQLRQGGRAGGDPASRSAAFQHGRRAEQPQRPDRAAMGVDPGSDAQHLRFAVAAQLAEGFTQRLTDPTFAPRGIGHGGERRPQRLRRGVHQPQVQIAVRATAAPVDQPRLGRQVSLVDQRLHRQIGQALGRGRRLSCNECAHHQLLNLAGGL